jgi:DNA-binding transcriptional MerR regulator
MTMLSRLSRFDKARLSIHEVTRFTGMSTSRIGSYKRRGLFREQYPQGRGGPFRRPKYLGIRRSYTLRDVLRLDVLAAFSKYNLPPQVMAKFRSDLDSAIEIHERGERLPEIPKHAVAAWAWLSLDFDALIERRVKHFPKPKQGAA